MYSFYPYNSANGINQQSVSLKIKRKLFCHVILVLCIMYYLGKLQSTVLWCGFCLFRFAFLVCFSFALSDVKNSYIHLQETEQHLIAKLFV